MDPAAGSRWSQTVLLPPGLRPRSECPCLAPAAPAAPTAAHTTQHITDVAELSNRTVASHSQEMSLVKTCEAAGLKVYSEWLHSFLPPSPSECRRDREMAFVRTPPHAMMHRAHEGAPLAAHGGLCAVMPAGCQPAQDRQDHECTLLRPYHLLPHSVPTTAPYPQPFFLPLAI